MQNLRHTILTLLAYGLVTVSATSLATPQTYSTQPSSQTNYTITLYQNHSAQSKAVTQTNITQPMVVIYQNPKQPDWVKVGLQNSGQVGWIQRSAYRQALNDYNKPQIQSFSITSKTIKDAKGKPFTQIVAYQNGKKLSPAAAQSAYYNLVSQQQQQDQILQANIQRINYELQHAGIFAHTYTFDKPQQGAHISTSPFNDFSQWQFHVLQQPTTGMRTQPFIPIVVYDYQPQSKQSATTFSKQPQPSTLQPSQKTASTHYSTEPSYTTPQQPTKVAVTTIHQYPTPTNIP